MNVARSTFVRRGYLLTALAVAVLLAASSGTAWAQTLGFRTARGTVEEGASTNAATPAPLKVTITRSSSGFDGPDTDDPPDGESNAPLSGIGTHVVLSAVEYDGVPSPSSVPFTFAARSGDSTASTTVTLGTAFSFGAEQARTDGVATTIELTISHNPDDGDWNDETLVLRLSADTALTTHLENIEKTLRYGTRELTVTVEDDDPTPKLSLDMTDIQLARGNKQEVNVTVGTGARGTGSLSSDIRTTLDGLDGSTGTATGDDLVLVVDPADAVGRILDIYRGSDPMATGATLQTDRQGRLIVGKIGGGGDSGAVSTDSATDGIMLTIEAKTVSGFRDERISLTLMDGRTDAEKRGEGGPIDDSVPATVAVLSGEETPTVTFSKDSVSIEEGGMETVHLLADTDQGDQVGSATVSVSGDATISLEQNGSPISGGVVSFGDSANAELTVRALPDRSLETGDEKMATVTIIGASGANIGDPRELTVTVVGSTEIPALPLIGQLLLAVFLAVGGARLYRRRQQ